ncbi:MAG: CDP-diacylglycerol--serine O-phosphatidyltransferase, partial [Alphaproteobacteria bacterium]
MTSLFQPFTPDKNEPPRKRFRPVPLRILIPNMITLLSLCAGLSAIRMAIEDKIDLAVYLILLAGVLDSMDGRIARLMKGTTKFGAELDSLADFVSFGAVPVVVLYLWGMNGAGPIGWVAVLVFAICGALRLARFNVQSEDPNRPAWMGNYFTGVPIPAAAILVLLPVYLEHLGVSRSFLP